MIAANLGLLLTMIAWGSMIPALNLLLATWDPWFLAAVRYAVPTAGVMWVSIEITHEWGLFTQFWTQPTEYVLEMSILVGAFVVALLLAVVMPRRRTTGKA